MLKKLKVAFVADYMTDFGGSDRLLFSLLKIFPDADIYTSIFEKAKYPNFKNNVYTTFLQSYVFRKIIRRVVSVFTPLAFENLNLMKGYDLVISLSAGASKGVITSTNQKHISIILTPPRHLWDKEVNIRSSVFKGIIYLFSNIFSIYMRVWDQTAVKRIDHIVTISEYIQKKVKKIYKRDSRVIYPGISNFWYEGNRKEEAKKAFEKLKEKHNLPTDYLLVVSRLYDYKRIDWAIRACRENNQNLLIVGSGPDRAYLEKLSTDLAKNGKGLKESVKFLGNVDDNSLRILYNNAQAFIFSGIEDYCYVCVEAMASGCPVLAFNDGGVTETVKNGITGSLFNSYDELESFIKQEIWKMYNSEDCRERSKEFTEKIFLKAFTQYLEDIYEREEK